MNKTQLWWNTLSKHNREWYALLLGLKPMQSADYNSLELSEQAILQQFTNLA